MERDACATSFHIRLSHVRKMECKARETRRFSVFLLPKQCVAPQPMTGLFVLLSIWSSGPKKCVYVTQLAYSKQRVALFQLTSHSCLCARVFVREHLYVRAVCSVQVREGIGPMRWIDQQK